MTQSQRDPIIPQTNFSKQDVKQDQSRTRAKWVFLSCALFDDITRQKITKEDTYYGINCVLPLISTLQLKNKFLIAENQIACKTVSQ